MTLLLSPQITDRPYIPGFVISTSRVTLEALAKSWVREAGTGISGFEDQLRKFLEDKAQGGRPEAEEGQKRAL